VAAHRTRADPTRRAVIAATAALPLVVAGCRGADALGTPPRPSGPAVRLRAAITAEQLMVARYQVIMRRLEQPGAASPAARAVLAQLAAEHAAHLRQLRARLIAGSPRAAGSGPLQPVRAAAAVPASVADAGRETQLRFLVVAEQAASDRLLGEVTRVPGALAQLLASIGASEATHVPALLTLAGTG
jgi:hypothetical protein